MEQPLDEEAEKQTYINENIIDQGYNPEDLANFITRKRAAKIEDLTLKQLKKIIEQFKTEQLSNTFNAYNQQKEKEEVEKEKEIEKNEKQKENEQKEEKKMLFNSIYAPEEYEITCKKQEENPLIDLESKKIRIKITLSDPKVKIITSKKYFIVTNKSVLTYQIEATEINSTVRRSVKDIEWLRNKLLSVYPYRIIPPLPESKMLESEKDEKTVRYLIGCFFDEICRRKILRTSKILYSFLTLEEDKFNELKEKNENEQNIGSDLSNLFSNIITVNGQKKFSLVQNTAMYVNVLKAIAEPSIMIYDRIYDTINNVINDYNNLGYHFNELSEMFELALKNGRKLKQSENINKYFIKLTEIFKNLSDYSIKASQNFNNDFKDLFLYMKLEYSNIVELHKSFESCRKNYESTATSLLKVKEYLFNVKAVDKWDLNEEDKKNTINLASNKNLAFEKMLPKETSNCKKLKEKLILIISFISNDHSKMMKHQDTYLMDHLNEFVKNNDEIISANFNFFNLISKFNINLVDANK